MINAASRSRCAICLGDVLPSAISGSLHDRRGLVCEQCVTYFEPLRTVPSMLEIAPDLEQSPQSEFRRRVLGAIQTWARQRGRR